MADAILSHGMEEDQDITACTMAKGRAQEVLLAKEKVRFRRQPEAKQICG